MRSILSFQKTILALLVTILPIAVYAETFHYFDGERKVALSRATGLLAEKTSLVGGGSIDSSLVRKADSSATLTKNVGSLRIWKTNADSTQSAISKASGKSIAEKNYLPVFKSSSGSLVVPVGNIIVYFQPDMTEEHVTEWAAKRGLRPSKKLPLTTKNVWEITTPAGIQAIELANEVIADSEVITSSPNFWMEFSTR